MHNKSKSVMQNEKRYLEERAELTYHRVFCQTQPMRLMSTKTYLQAGLRKRKMRRLALNSKRKEDTLLSCCF